MRKSVSKAESGPKKKPAPPTVKRQPMPAKAAKSVGVTVSKKLTLPKDLQVQMLDLMIKARVLEERLIKIYRAGDAYFWIGGPGEEAFGVPLGLLTHKGHGPEYDFLHLHYRATPTLVALGMPMIDSIRLMMNRVTDPSTGGRNFCNHYCFPQWNVVPVSSPIEVQYGAAVGTAMAQQRRKSKGQSAGISIVSGGDAGTAEGDFAGCLIWASRPQRPLPILITVQNNKWGISTSYDTQHAEKNIADRGKAFGIRTAIINGNDPIETYLAIQTEMDYIRKTGRPVLAEFRVSRLYGHSSASGANRESDICPIMDFEKRIVDQKLISSSDIKKIWTDYEREAREATEQVRGEGAPTSESIWDNVFVGNENADWRKF